MLKRPFWMFAALTGAALCAAVQVRVNYRDRDFTLSGFDKFSATLETDSIAFGGSGAPLRIDSASKGLTVTGNDATGTAARGADRSYFLKDLTISGKAHVSAESSSTASAKPEPEKTSTDISSDSIHFTGTSESGRVDFPSPATIDSKSSGVRTTQDRSSSPFERVLHLTGSAGFVTLQLTGPGSGKPQTGELSGPVTFTLTQTDGAGSTVATQIEGSGDKLTFSVGSEPRTVTLEGNVKATGKSDVFTGDLTADSMVVTLGPDLQPIKVEVKGNPARTHGSSPAGNGSPR